MYAILDALRQHWQLALGVVVVAAAAALVARAYLRDSGDEEPERLRERRGKLTEDLLTLAVAAIAAGLSAHALTAFAQKTLGLHGAWRLMPFGALDAAAVVCAIRARRRANRGDGPGVNGPLVWVFAGISAVFSAGDSGAAHQPVTVWGALGHGIWALVAATLWEIGLIEQRRSHQERPDRRVGWIRWLHPVERLQVLGELAADTSISADDATVRVRQRRAAWTLYRLHIAVAALERLGAASAESRELVKAERRARRIERRTQSAAVRVQLADPDTELAVLPQLRILVDVRQIAARGGRPATSQNAPSASQGASPVAASATPPTPLPAAAGAAANPSGPAPATPSPLAGVPAVSTAAAAAPSGGQPAVPAGGATPRPAAAPQQPAAPPAPAPVNGTARPTTPPPNGTSPASQGPGTAATSTHGSSLSQPSAIPSQGTGPGTSPAPLDGRIQQILQWLATEPNLSGAEAARRLNTSVRTGQRLWRAAHEELQQRAMQAPRRLQPVGQTP
jgi:hypothetical protein